MIVCGTGGKVYHKETNLCNLKAGELEFCSSNLGYAYCNVTGGSLTFEFFDDTNNSEFKYILKK